MTQMVKPGDYITLYIAPGNKWWWYKDKEWHVVDDHCDVLGHQITTSEGDKTWTRVYGHGPETVTLAAPDVPDVRDVRAGRS